MNDVAMIKLNLVIFTRIIHFFLADTELNRPSILNESTNLTKLKTLLYACLYVCITMDE